MTKRMGRGRGGAFADAVEGALLFMNVCVEVRMLSDELHRVQTWDSGSETERRGSRDARTISCGVWYEKWV